MFGDLNVELSFLGIFHVLILKSSAAATLPFPRMSQGARGSPQE